MSALEWVGKFVNMVLLVAGGIVIGVLLSQEPRQAAYPNIQWLACDEGKVCLTYADFRRLDRAMVSLQEGRLECLQTLSRQ